MTYDTGALRRGLAERIPVADPAWRVAVADVAREVFLGDAFFRPTETDRGTVFEPVRRGTVAEEEWARLVYADETWVTQVGGVDATEADGPLRGDPTSSSTLPSLVVRMLELTGIADGDRVLEIGTGTGYSTAILCHRLGDTQVTSVEYDPAVAHRAARRLASLGRHPTLVTGDGLDGYTPGAEYDRLVATCSVRYVPTAWLWQVRAGGTITATLSGWMQAHGLVRLAVDEDGGAGGRFVDEPISYMTARPHAAPPRPASVHLHRGTSRPVCVDPALVHGWTPGFVAQLAAPTAQLLGSGADVILLDVATGSQARTHTDHGERVVSQWGPLRLWDSVEDALLSWQDAGSPAQSAFGMTITPDDYEQTVWLGDPAGPSWRLPA